MNGKKVIKLSIWMGTMLASVIVPVLLIGVVLNLFFEEHMTSILITSVIVVFLTYFYIDILHVYLAVKLKLPELLRCYNKKFQYKMQKLMGNGN